MATPGATRKTQSSPPIFLASNRVRQMPVPIAIAFFRPIRFPRRTLIRGDIGAMARPSVLQFFPQRPSGTANGETLYHSADGVPILWFLCFGTRNNWTPGDKVEDRGGTASERDRFLASAEDALYRLEQVETNLREAPLWWPWFAGLPVLRRKLESRPKSGWVRLHAPWAFATTAQSDALIKVVPALENAVNLLGAGQHAPGVLSLRITAEFLSFTIIGDGTDHSRLDSGNHAAAGSTLGQRLLIATLGTPAQDAESWLAKNGDPLTAPLMALRSNPPILQPKVSEKPPTPDRPGFFKRVFGRKG